MNYPLSRRQEALWFDEDIHSDTPVNNVLTRFIIRGEIKTDAFISAFSRLCSQSPVLRSVVEVDKLKGQRIFRFQESIKAIDIIEAEVDSVSGYQQTSKFQDWVNHKFTYVDSLSKAQLVKFSNELFVFYLNQHHSITDGFSCSQLHSSLSAYYQIALGQLSQSDVTEAAAGSDNYVDYLNEKAVNNHSITFEENENFWKSHYSLPVDPVVFYNQSTFYKTAKTSRITHTLDEKTSVLIRESSISVSLLFSSVLFAFLNRITLNKDLSIGVPLLNRKDGYSQAIGLFMEVCPNRLLFSEEDTFDSVIKKVQMEIEAVREHRDHFVSSKIAGYEVILNILSEKPASFAGLPVEYELTTPLNVLDELRSEIPEITWTGKESLAIQIQYSPSENNFELNFDFNMGVWISPVLRERAVEHFEIILKELLNDRKQRITEINLITSEEKALLFPEEDSAYSRGDTVSSVTDLFTQQVMKTPDKVAVQFNDKNISYLELLNDVEDMAQQLCEFGVKPGVLVGVCIDRSHKMVMCLLAIMRAGGAYVPIDPKQPTDRIEIILEDASPLVIITETDLIQKIAVSSDKKIICLDNNHVNLAKKQQQLPNVSGGDLAYVIFTSGSTGRPKGVQVTHHGLTTFLQAMAKQPGMNSQDSLLSVTTISFDIAALELFLPLIIGATVRIAPYESTINGEALIALLRKDITVLQATPATYRLLLSSGWEGGPNLKIMCGGEALPYELAQKLLPKCQSLWNMYGPTETTIWSSVHKVSNEENNIPIGKPIEGTKMFVLTEGMVPVPIGVAGELYISGDGITNGYYGNEELTKKQFVPNPFSVIQNAKMYKTGDLVRYNQTMALEYIGRIDFQVKIRGFRIETGEIEIVLGGYRPVAQNIVVALPDEKGEQRLVAYLVEGNGLYINGKELYEFLQSKLPDYMIPSKFVLLESLPLTPNGKVNRKALPSPDVSKKISVGTTYHAPRNDFESSLISVWQGLLKLPKIGITDNFFELGGDSLMTVPLVHEMEQATGIKFDIGDIFNFPTIEQLVEVQENDVERRASSIVPLQRKGDGVPLFCILGINRYQELANSLGDARPIYGVYVSAEQDFLEDLLEGKKVDISVETLASAYYDAICRQQPEGPYQLLGLSFGGLLAVEVARMLKADNREVLSVILLDTILPTGCQRNLLSQCKQMIKRMVKTVTLHIGKKFGRSAIESLINMDYFRDQAFRSSLKKYESSGVIYDGKVVLMKAEDRSDWGGGISFSDDYGWQQFVKGKIDIYEVSGDHLSMVDKPNVIELARYILPYLK